ncbi:MAG: hypothetical protein MJA29_14600, partial [Candidatus Omnitrophica bacterium]|nr:hypothetical protein [Candidatus Omnitrophota bacterium]
MKRKFWPLPPGVWFIIVCGAVMALFVMLKPAEQMDVKRSPRARIKKTAVVGEEEDTGPSTDTACVARVNFYGAAGDTIYDDGMLRIEADEGRARRSYALVEFVEPVDFFKSTLTFFAKAGAAETMEVGFTDVKRRTTPKEDMVILDLEPDYKKLSVRGEDIRAYGIDKSRITAIKIGMSPARREKGALKQAAGRMSLQVKDIFCLSNS